MGIMQTAGFHGIKSRGRVGPWVMSLPTGWTGFHRSESPVILSLRPGPAPDVRPGWDKEQHFPFSEAPVFLSTRPTPMCIVWGVGAGRKTWCYIENNLLHVSRHYRACLPEPAANARNLRSLGLLDNATYID